MTNMQIAELLPGIEKILGPGNIRSLDKRIRELTNGDNGFSVRDEFVRLLEVYYRHREIAESRGNPFYVPNFKSIAQFGLGNHDQAYTPDLEGWVKKGYAEMSESGAARPSEILRLSDYNDKKTWNPHWSLLPDGLYWWTLPPSAEKAKGRKSRMQNKKREMGDAGEAAMKGIALHEVETYMLKLKSHEMIENAYQKHFSPNNKMIRQIVDLGTGEDPTKLIHLVNAVYDLNKAKFGLDALREKPLYVHLVEGNDVSLKESLQKCREAFRGKSIRFVGVNSTFQSLEKEIESNSNEPISIDKDSNNVALGISSDERISVMTGNTFLNPQDDIFAYSHFIPKSAAVLLTMHIMPDSDYDALLSGRHTRWTKQLGIHYSTRDVMNMGLHLVRSLWHLDDMQISKLLDRHDQYKLAGRASRIAADHRYDTIGLYVAKNPDGSPVTLSDSDTTPMLIPTAAPYWNNAYMGAGIPKNKMAKTILGKNYHMLVLNSLKPTLKQANRIVELLGCEDPTTIVNDSVMMNSIYHEANNDAIGSAQLQNVENTLSNTIGIYIIPGDKFRIPAKSVYSSRHSFSLI